MSASEPIASDADGKPDATPPICLACIGDHALRARLSTAAHRITCRYCGRTRRGVTLATLAAEVDEPLREFCVQGATVNQGATVKRYSAESDASWWEQEGEDLEEFLQNELEIDMQAASDLSDLLVANDPAWPPDGEEAFFDAGQRYHRAPATYIAGGQYSEAWSDFASRITHERRFFDAETTEHLGQILGTRGSPKAKSLPVLELGPGLPHTSVFRARCVFRRSAV